MNENHNNKMLTSSSSIATIMGEEAKEEDEEHRVLHDYHDHANDSVETMTTREMLLFTPMGMGTIAPHQRLNGQPPFPMKLHTVLEEVENDPSLSSIIAWQPHGRSFIVHRVPEFVNLILQSRFRQTKFASFQRQLNLYGFKRLTSGRDKGGYYHELFLRQKRFLCNRIHRLRNKGTGVRKPSSPETEPNFYNMPFLPQSGRVDRSNNRSHSKRDGRPLLLMAPAVSSSHGTGGTTTQATNWCFYREEVNLPMNASAPSPHVKSSSVHHQQPRPMVLPMSSTTTKSPSTVVMSSLAMDDAATVVTEGTTSAVSSTASLPQMMRNHETPIGALSTGSKLSAMGGIPMCNASAYQASTGTSGLALPVSQDSSKQGNLPYTLTDESIAPTPLSSTVYGNFMEPPRASSFNAMGAVRSNGSAAPSNSASATAVHADANSLTQGYQGIKMELMDEVLDSLYDSMAQPLNTTTFIPQSIPNTSFLGFPGADAATASIITQMTTPAVTALSDTTGNAAAGILMSNLSETATYNRFNDHTEDFDHLGFLPL